MTRSDARKLTMDYTAPIRSLKDVDGDDDIEAAVFFIVCAALIALAVGMGILWLT